MAKGGKDTSTDKLLNVIRGKGDAPGGSAGGSAAGAKRGKGKGRGAGKSAGSTRAPRGVKVSRKGGNKVVVGVDIGPDSLRIARVSHSGGRPKLLGFHRIPFETPDAPDRPDFP